MTAGRRRAIFSAAAALVLTATVLFAAGVRTIASPEAKRLLDSRRNIFLLDVRTPEEYRQARLKNAVLIPIAEIERRVGEIPKNRPVIVYCAVGARSHAIAPFLAKQGFGEVYDMADGIVGWHRNGFPLER